MSAIRKSDLQRIIREEYARVLLQRSGHRVTESRVRLIAEKIEDGELNELFAGLKNLARAGKKIYQAGEKKAAREKEEAENAAREERIRDAQAKFDSAKGKIKDDLVKEFGAIKQKVKDRAAKALGISAQDLVLAPDLAEAIADLADEALEAAKTIQVGQVSFADAPSTRGTRFVGSGGRG